MQCDEFNDLFPELTASERKEAAEILDRYLLLAWEIYRGGQEPAQEL